MKKLLFIFLLFPFISYAQQSVNVLYGPNEYFNGTIIGKQYYDILNGQAVSTAGVPNNAIISVAGGAHHILILDTLGNVWAKGDQASGELGNGVISGTPTTTFAKILTDSLGNPFTGVVAIGTGFTAGGWTSWAIKSDGTLWVWGATDGQLRGSNFPGTNNSRPVQVIFPGGIHIKQAALGPFGFALDQNDSTWSWGGSNQGFAGQYCLGQATGSPVFGTPTQIHFPHPCDFFAGSAYWNYFHLTNGSLYGTAFYAGYLGIGDTTLAYNQPGANTSPVLLDTALFSYFGGATIKQVVVNWSGTLCLLNNHKLFYWGDNSMGDLGNGVELYWPTYKNGTSSAPWNSDQGLGELMGGYRKPHQVGPGIYWDSVYSGNSVCFYWDGVDSANKSYGAGRDKGGVQPNGIQGPAGGGTGATYPNSWDLYWLTYFPNPTTIGIYVSPSPYCVLNPSGSPCNEYSIPVEAGPTANAGSTIHATVGTPFNLDGSASTTVGGYEILYSIWTKVSGPNAAPPLGGFIKSPVTNLIPGTDVYQLYIEDNNRKSQTANVTVVTSLSNMLSFPAGSRIILH